VDSEGFSHAMGGMSFAQPQCHETAYSLLVWQSYDARDGRKSRATCLDITDRRHADIIVTGADNYSNMRFVA
jgi:hypothetical protein